VAVSPPSPFDNERLADSVRSQRVAGIDAHGGPCWDQACGDCRSGEHNRGRRPRDRVSRAHSEQKRSEQPRQRNGAEGADGKTTGRERKVAPAEASGSHRTSVPIITNIGVG